MTNHRVCNKSNTTGVVCGRGCVLSSGTGTAFSPGTLEFFLSKCTL
jgi:hypothetical protein